MLINTLPDGRCQYCGTKHQSKCSLIRAIEYEPGTGLVRKIEFFSIAEFQIRNKNFIPEIMPIKVMPAED